MPADGQLDGLLHDWLLTSKVYRSCPIRVRIYKDAASLKKAAISYGILDVGHLPVQGLYMSGPMWSDSAPGRPSDHTLGHILLHAGQSGVGTITHEFQHAFMDLLFRKGKFKRILLDRLVNKKKAPSVTRWAGAVDEKVCNYAGDMLSQFWKKWYQYVEKTKRNE